jgi:hypothetical protein
MIFVLLGLAIVGFLLWLAYSRLRTTSGGAPSGGAPSPDSQYQVFRDMEPASQVRENPWVGFIQEDVSKTGPIGNFEGNDSSSGRAVLYMIT